MRASCPASRSSAVAAASASRRWNRGCASPARSRFGGLDLPMNEERANVLLRQAKAVLPGLEASDFSIWMGFRPSFPDSLPVIDEAPGRRGLFLAFGHGHTGMTGGAPTGRLVKQLVAGEPADVPLAPYSARRFH